jgi:phosphotriesterase-related protein
LTKSELSGLAQTVLGPVDPSTLGMTTTHEHIFIDFVCMYTPPTEASVKHLGEEKVSLENLGWVRYDPFRNRDNLELLDEETAIYEIGLFGRVGGGTIVDATTIGIGRDPLGLARVARATGVNIVMGAGYYVDIVHPAGMDDLSEDDITQQIIDELTVGVGTTGVKAGIIGELGCSWPLTENERKVLRAGARAQRATGAGILIHPGRNPRAPFEILDVLESAGADVSRVIMGHLDRTIFESETLLELADRGSMLEYDLFGWETSYYSLAAGDIIHDGQRLDYVQLLIDKGHVSQVVLAQDVYSKSRTFTYGGYGYGHLIENIVPRMRNRGMPEEQIRQIMIENPARILTFE